MRSFDTILLQSKEVVVGLIEKVPLNDIALALKYEEQDIRDYFCKNMTKDRKDILFALFTEIDEATPEDCKKAQEYIMKFLDEMSIENGE